MFHLLSGVPYYSLGPGPHDLSEVQNAEIKFWTQHLNSDPTWYKIVWGRTQVLRRV